MKQREKGDKYRPMVEIIKTKKGVPTVITVSGSTYTLHHPDQYRGRKK